MCDLQGTVALLGALGDPSRIRLLALAQAEELSVAELTQITELPQSRVSTHLARLHTAGLLCRRRVGPSTLYTVNDVAMPAAALQLWASMRRHMKDDVLRSDLDRCRALVASRDQAASWPDVVAGEMERHYSPGRTWEATTRALVGLLRLGDVLDVGSGDGAAARLLAPRCTTLTCLDHSEHVLRAARHRLDTFANVRLARGDMHQLPFADASFDQLLLFHVLTYADDPARALAEAHRVLRPDGDLVLATLRAHSHLDIASMYSHINEGFSCEGLESELVGAGFEVTLCDVTSRERRKPHFEVITAFARKP
ncbi:MAG: metalloregulator ArsR/SmtB family transcription factor [Nannocystaceae bacterium]